MPSPSRSRPSALIARWNAHASTARVAVWDEAGEHGFGAIDARARAIAATLLDGRASLEGERVAVLAPPGASFVAAFFGVLHAGGSVVVLSPLHPPRETEYVCEHAEVRALLVAPALSERVGSLAAGRRVLSLGDGALGGAEGAGRELASPADDDAALQLYTSGTTGKPKGAILTHENLAVQQGLLGRAWGFCAGDVLLHALPLHHLHGLAVALLTALGAGARTRILPGFDARSTWDAMADCTVFMAVPTMYAKLFAALDGADPTTRARWSASARALRLATSGSAALPATLAERWRSVTGAYPLERFGMTEIGVGIANPLEGARRPGYVGMPLPSVETRVVSDDLLDAPSGELWIRGPSVFRGYWRDDEATRQAFAEGGWFRTGDTVTRDEVGYFKILGRTSVDILKSGGYKLSALEIEEVLRENGAVADVAVIGVPDETWGERVVACVVPAPGRDAECAEEALRAFCRARLASYKVPKTVLVLGELPRNVMGKVVKPELSRQVAGFLVRGGEAAEKSTKVR